MGTFFQGMRVTALSQERRMAIQCIIGIIVGAVTLWLARWLFEPGVPSDLQMFYYNLYFGIAGCVVAIIDPEFSLIAPISIVVGETFLATIVLVPLSLSWPLSFLAVFFFALLNSTYIWLASVTVFGVFMIWSRWRAKRELVSGSAQI